MINSDSHPFSNSILTVSSSLKQNIYEHIINPKIKYFFEKRSITFFEEIPYEKYISDLDFKIFDFSFFYEQIFNDIKKTDEGDIIFTTKYCISFDKTACLQFCDASEIYFDSINAYHRPILFFIYINIQEFYDFIRKTKSREV